MEEGIGEPSALRCCLLPLSRGPFHSGGEVEPGWDSGCLAFCTPTLSRGAGTSFGGNCRGWASCGHGIALGPHRGRRREGSGRGCPGLAEGGRLHHGSLSHRPGWGTGGQAQQGGGLSLQLDCWEGGRQSGSIHAGLGAQLRPPSLCRPGGSLCVSHRSLGRDWRAHKSNDRDGRTVRGPGARGE